MMVLLKPKEMILGNFGKCKLKERKVGWFERLPKELFDPCCSGPFGISVSSEVAELKMNRNVPHRML